jgi:hypothetical protein
LLRGCCLCLWWNGSSCGWAGTGAWRGVAKEVDCRRLLLLGRRLGPGLARGSREALRGGALDLDLLLNLLQRHVVVVLAQFLWTGHGAVHDPTLRLVLCADKVLNLGLGGHMPWSQLGLPVFVGASIAPAQDALQLLVCPRVEVDRLDFADVGAHAAVDSGATDADEDAEVPAGPSRVWVCQLGWEQCGCRAAYACCACSRNMSCCPRA